MYEVLGVSKTASERDIKSAYKRLSIKYHPDKNKDVPKEEAEKVYTEIVNAYEVLSDPEKRRLYDQGGDQAIKNANQGGTNDPLELIRRMTGQSTQTTGSKKDKKAGPDFPAFLDVDLEELYMGTHLDIIIAHRVICSKCSGTGARKGGMTTCPKCQGRGMFVQQQQTVFGIINMQQQCDACGATGKVVGKKCGKCKGEGAVLQDDHQVVFIDRGSMEGEEMSYKDMGDAGPDYETGRLVLKIHERPHETFVRKKHDLHTHVDITLKEALTGTVAILTHLDGRKIPIDRTGRCTSHGEVVMIKGEGMPNKDDTQFNVKGDLYVEFRVIFPSSLTPDQLKLVDQLFPTPKGGEAPQKKPPTDSKNQDL